MRRLTAQSFNLRAWPSRLVFRYLTALLFVAFLVANYVLWYDTQVWDSPRLPKSITFGAKHPIKKLMLDARLDHEAALARQSTDLASAAQRYRDARGRHPPPGFDKWFQAAMNAEAIIVEDFFDRIYKDLNPFWALDPKVIRERSNSWGWVVQVRKGKAKSKGEVSPKVPWLKLWTGIVASFAPHLPDVDMPLNPMDESRIIVPHDQLSKLVQTEADNRAMPPLDKVMQKYAGLEAVDAADIAPYEPTWLGPDNSYWNLAVKGCGPHTPAYEVQQIEDWAAPAQFPHRWQPSYAFNGFIQNWTAATDPCLQPHLRQLHGTFIEPISLSTTEELIPLFAGSKLPMNNEILIPGAMYLTEEERYSGGDSLGPSWNRKIDGLMWRGDATGGRTHEDTWHHFQRQRLVDMLNATTVAEMESGGQRALTFELPPQDVYPSYRLAHGGLAQWLGSFADAAFVHFCWANDCDWMKGNFIKEKPVKMKEQYKHKFLPDADGNSFSARFRSFLRSTSVPLKATVYKEWHDDRLTPWLHFVPLDNTFQDLYPVLEYFADRDGPGDEAARLIAERGQVWADKVLRKEDMALYMWRLLLEWARVCDENRDYLGFVADLRPRVETES